MANLKLKIPVFSRVGLLISLVWLFSCLVGSSAKYLNSWCNNNELYNNYNQICCKGKIQNRLLGQECCGGTQFYKTNTSLCCENNLKDRYITHVCPKNKKTCEKEELIRQKCSSNDVNCEEQMCCGKESISKEDAICCFGNKIILTLSQKKDRDFLECCNETTLYDLRSEICCGKKKHVWDNGTIDCCGDTFFRHDTGNCLFSVSETGHLNYIIGNKSEGMCGDHKYNKNINGCCLGVLNNVPEYNPEFPNLNEPNPHFSCCDSLVMNPIEKKCCRNHHFPNFPTHTILNRPEIKCCGNGSYNTTQETCYNGKIFKIKTDRLLCGGSYYDPDLQGCCLNKVYHKDSELCCNGNLNITVIPKNFICCNGVGISHGQLCCEGFMPLSKTEPDDDECCFNGDHPVATFTRLNDQRCVNGAVVEGYKEGTEPCGLRGFYDVATEICCGGQVISKSKGDKCCDSKAYNSDTHECCSDVVFNPHRQQCCHDVLYNIAPNDGRCCYINGVVYKFNDSNNPCIKDCSGSLYDESFQVCCERKVYNYEEEFACCGEKYIDSSVTDCCAGHPYPAKPQRSCCGRFYVNLKKKNCCGEAYPYNSEGKIQCCGDRELYDTSLSKCDLNKVVNKFNDTQKLCQLKNLKNLDQINKHGCNRKFGFKALIQAVRIKRSPKFQPDIVELHLTRVSPLKNIKQKPNFGYSHTLVLKVFVQKDNKVKCRQRYFTKMEIIVLLDQRAEGKTINVKENSNFFVSRYTKRIEKIISEASYSCNKIKSKRLP